jgi:hypothetical protein
MRGVYDVQSVQSVQRASRFALICDLLFAICYFLFFAICYLLATPSLTHDAPAPRCIVCLCLPSKARCAFVAFAGPAGRRQLGMRAYSGQRPCAPSRSTPPLHPQGGKKKHGISGSLFFSLKNWAHFFFRPRAAWSNVTHGSVRVRCPKTLAKALCSILTHLGCP